MRPILACVCAAGCWSGAIGARAPAPRKPWAIHHAGGARAVAIDGSGDVFAVWQRSDPDAPLVVARHRGDDGHEKWNRELTSKPCGEPTFAPAIAIAPSGDIIVAAAVGTLGPICIADFDRDGALAWSVKLDTELSIPLLAIDRGGQIVVAGRADVSGLQYITALGPDGRLAWRTAVPMDVVGVSVTDAGETHAWSGHALVTLTHAGRIAARRTEAHDVVAVDASGAIYETAKVEGTDRGDSIELVKLAASGAELWSKTMPTRYARVFAAAHRLAVQSGVDTRRIAILDRDGDVLGRFSIDADIERSQVSIRMVQIDGIAIGERGVAIAGEGAKHVWLGVAGDFTTPCHLVSRTEPDDTPRVVHDEACDDAGWLALFPLALSR